MLRGAGGVAIGLPFLEAMLPRGKADDEFPKRFVVFFKPDGYMPGHFWPTGTESAFTLGETLAPLEPHKRDLIIIRGLHQLGFHPTAIGAMLTGQELNPGPFHVPNTVGSFGWANGISIDQAIAEHLRSVGVATRFRSLELGAQTGQTDQGCTVCSRMSYLGPDRPVPPENSPYNAFARIFGDLTADRIEVERLRVRRRSVLDAVTGEYDRLRRRVGGADARRLDEHLGAIREIETRLGSGSPIPAACEVPDVGAPMSLTANDNFPAIGRLQMDLLVTSLACDLTRVGSIMWSNSLSDVRHTWVGAGSHHFMAHQDPEHDPAYMTQLVAVNRWYAEQFAYLLQKMKEVPEGGGTLLDHTVVLWSHELALGDRHSAENIPYILAGGLSGTFRTGRFLDLDVSRGLRGNDLLLALLNAFGSTASSFGKAEWSAGPLVGLA